jgi:hypothetical protein
LVDAARAAAGHNCHPLNGKKVERPGVGRLGIRSPQISRKPKAWTSIGRDYEQVRVNMQTLFGDLALTTLAPLAG